MVSVKLCVNVQLNHQTVLYLDYYWSPSVLTYVNRLDARLALALATLAFPFTWMS